MRLTCGVSALSHTCCQYLSLSVSLSVCQSVYLFLYLSPYLSNDYSKCEDRVDELMKYKAKHDVLHGPFTLICILS